MEQDCFTMNKMICDPSISLDQLAEQQHVIQLLEEEEFWGGESVMSPIFALSCDEIRRDS